MRNYIRYLWVCLFTPCLSTHAQMPADLEGWAVTTNYSFSNDFVLALRNLKPVSGAAPGVEWAPATLVLPAWNRDNLGSIFGIAIDSLDDFYVSTCFVNPYGNTNTGPGGAAGIYRIDHNTGAINVFTGTTAFNLPDAAILGGTSLPNSNNSLGNICYNGRKDLIYASNFEDGRIYTIEVGTGMVRHIYDPIYPANYLASANPALIPEVKDTNLPPLGDRIWAVAYHLPSGRLYFSVWVEDQGINNPNTNNAIFSVGLDASGFPDNDIQPEFLIPNRPGFSYSSPVSDIAFDGYGTQMLLAERTVNESGNPLRLGEDMARGLKYIQVGSSWVFDQQIYLGSNGPVGQSAAGGCDFGFHDEVCDSMLWFSIDRMGINSGGKQLYGYYGTHQPGNQGGNYYADGYFVDYDPNNVQFQNKNYLGDIEIFNGTCDCPLPTVDLGSDDSICFGETLLLWDGQDGLTYMWQDSSTNSFFEVADTGWFWLRVANECGEAIDSVYIGLKGLVPEVDLGPDTTVCVLNPISYNVSFPGATYLWSDGTKDSTYTITNSGMHWVELQTVCGLVRDEVTVNLMPELQQPDLGSDTMFCESSSITLDAYQYTAQYLWSDGSTLRSFEITDPGTYWVTVYNMCDTLSDTINYSVLTEYPNIQLGPDSILCSGDSLLLDATTSHATYNWSDGSTDATLIATETGWYYVEVTNLCGYDMDAIYLQFQEDLLAVDLGNDTSICSGDTLKLEPDVHQGNHLWSNGSTDSVIWVSSEGWYHLRQSNQCDTVRDSIYVQILDSLPRLELGPDTILCKGQTLNFNFSDTLLQYRWSDGSNNAYFEISQPGLYWLMYFRSCDTLRDSIHVDFQGQIPRVDLGPDTNLCFGDTLLLILPDTNGSYLWNNGSTDTFMIVTTSGNYRVEGTNECQTVRDSIQVTYYVTPPQIKLPNDTMLCNGDTLFIQVSDSGAVYEWQDGSTEDFFSITSEGWYWLKADNPCGTSLDSIYVRYESPISSDPLPSSLFICVGDSLLLDPNITQVSPVWNTTDTLDTLWVSQEGWYWYLATNTCGQVRDSSYLNVEDEFPNFNLGSDSVLCTGDSVVLVASKGVWLHLWQDGSTDTLMIARTTGWYWVEVSNICGIHRDSIYLEFQEPLAVPFLGLDTVLCRGDSLWLYAHLVGEGTILWNDGSSTDSILITNDGLYWLEMSNACGMERDSIQVHYQDPLLPVYIGEDTIICEGNTVELYVQENSGSIVWNTGSTDTNITVSQTGWYWVQSTNVCGTESDTIYVQVDVQPMPFELGSDTILCLGDTLILNIPYSYTQWIWSDGTMDSILKVYEDQLVFLTMFNACDTISNSLEVSFVSGIPEFQLPDDTLICDSDIVVLHAYYPGASNLWSDGELDTIMSVESTGWYWLQMENECGIVRDSVHIVELEPLENIDLGNDTAICEYTEITFDVSQYGVSYLWNDNSTDSFLIAGEPGIYWVQGTNQCGVYRDSMELYWAYCKCELYIANAFSPNGDGLNEVFMPKFTCDVSDYYFVIYDRWGKMVFETNNQHEAWDGTIFGQIPKEDVYAFQLFWTFPDGERKIKEDRVTLLR